MADLLTSGAVRAWTTTVDGVFGLATASIDAQRSTVLGLLKANKAVFDLAERSFRSGLDRAGTVVPEPRSAPADAPAPVVDAPVAAAPVVETPAPVVETPVAEAPVPAPAAPEAAAPETPVDTPVVVPAEKVPAKPRAAKTVRKPATPTAATPAKPRARRTTATRTS